jgi:hypothetical protein
VERWLAAWLGLAAAGCGAAALPALPSRSSHADPPPTWSSPSPSLRAGASGGLVSGGGRDQAHDLFVEVLLAIVDADDARLTACFAERVEQLSLGLRGAHAAPRAATDRATLVRQAMAAVRAARLTGDEELADLVERESVEIVRLGDLVSVPLPDALSPSDLVVQFRATTAGRRALSVIAPGGVGLVVVRPGGSPRVVAR